MKNLKYKIFLSDDKKIVELKYSVIYNICIFLVIFFLSMLFSLVVDRTVDFNLPFFSIFIIVFFVFCIILHFVKKNVLTTILKIDFNNGVIYINKKPYLLEEIKFINIDIEPNINFDTPAITRYFIILKNEKYIKFEQSYSFNKELILSLQQISDLTKVKLLINGG